MADQSSSPHDAMFIEQVKRAQQLEAQRQKDPRAIEPLIRIYEWLLGELVANDDPETYAAIHGSLGDIYRDMPASHPTNNLEQALTHYQQVLYLITPEIDPVMYTMTQLNLGNIYRKRTKGERAANLAQAARFYEDALHFFTRERARTMHANIQRSLNIVRQELRTLSQDDYEVVPPGFVEEIKEVERLAGLSQREPQAMIPLIQVYERLLAQVRPDEYPAFYYTLQKDLGRTYHKLPTKDPLPNLTRAIGCYEEALRFFTPETHLRKYASIRNSLGLAYMALPTKDPTPHLTWAIQCFQETLHVFIPQLDPYLYAIIQSNLGNAYYHLPAQDRRSNVKNAIRCWQEALNFILLKGNELEYAGIKNNLGSAYMGLLDEDHPNNVTQAIACFQEALRVLAPKDNPTEYGGILSSLGNAYYELSKRSQANHLAQAIHYYQEALCFVTADNAPFVYAGIQNNLGSAYRNLSTGDQVVNLARAIGCFHEALRIITVDNAPLDYVGIQNNLGNAYCVLPTGNRGDNLKLAISCYQEALRFPTAKADHLAYAEIQANLANAYYFLPTGDRMGNLTQAIHCLEEALRIFTPEATPSQYAMAQNNLGTIYLALPGVNKVANHEKAIECFQNALRFRASQNEPLKYAETQNNLGLAYRRQAITYRNPSDEYRKEKLTRSIDCFQEALRFYTAQKAPLMYGELQNNLGLTYADMPAKDTRTSLAKAIEHYQEALRYLTPRANPAKYAIIQNNLGIAYNRLQAVEDLHSNRQRAIQCFQEALSFQKLEAEPHVYRMTARNLADLYFAQGEWDTALQHYRSAMNAGEQLYLTGLSAESKAAEMHENASLYTHAAFAAVRCGNPTEALLILERGKTRLLTETLRLRVPRPPHVPNDIWNTFEQACERLSATQNEDAFGDERADPIQIYQNRIKSAQEDTQIFNEAVERVRAYAPHFLATLDLPSIEAQLIDKQIALISFCITEQGSVGFIMSQRSPEKIQAVEIPDFTQMDLHHLTYDSGQQPIGGWLGDYDLYLNNQITNMTTWQKTITHTLAELGIRVLKPLLSALPGGIEHLVLLPTADLFLFPLHAVPLPGNDSGLLLCDKYEISYVPSLEVRAHESSIIQMSEPSLYAVINPAANARLPFASLEGTALAQLFTRSQVVSGQAAIKEQVLVDIQTQTYVHFACHGSYDWDDPSLSGLFLANKQLLTLADLQSSSLDLSQSRLVTLSACETGITDVLRNSPAEYVGIPAGFLMAGVPCVIGSLWSVPDISTAMLMEHFYYQHLRNGKSIASALREAQHWLRHLDAASIATYATRCYQQANQWDTNKKKLHDYENHYRKMAEEDPMRRLFEHPYYWAAFTVNGI